VRSAPESSVVDGSTQNRSIMSSGTKKVEQIDSDDDFAEKRHCHIALGCKENPRDPNILYVTLKKPATSNCDTPSMYLQLTVGRTADEAKDEIAVAMGNRSDEFFRQFADPALFVINRISSATTNISKSGTAETGIRPMVFPLPEGWVVPAGAVSGKKSETIEYLKLCCVLREPNTKLGGGKDPQSSSRSGGSQAEGNIAVWKTSYVSTQVLEYEKNETHGDCPDKLKSIKLTGGTRQARRSVLMEIVNKAIAPTINELKETKPLPTKIHAFDMFATAISLIDLDALPGGAQKHTRHKKKKRDASDNEEEEEQGKAAAADPIHLQPVAPIQQQQPAWKLEIIALNDLHKDGVLSAEQCETAKQAILVREGLAPA
jgi:hypothetical protein